MKSFYFLLMAMVFTLLSGCGMQGDLYLPDEDNKTQKPGALISTSHMNLDVVYKNRVYKV